MLSRTLALQTLATVALLASPVQAHDIWVVTQKQGDQTVAQIRYADPAKPELADKGKVVDLKVITPTATINLKRPLTPDKSGLALESKPFAAPSVGIISVTYDNGYYAVSPVDKVETNTSKMLTTGATESWWVPKFGKTLLGPGSQAVRAGTLMELIPLADPFALPPGKPLPVRLELKGKPLPGVKVVYGDGVAPIPEKEMPFVTTDREGVALVPISGKGAWLLTADYEGPPSQPVLADKDDTYASLAFDTSN